MKPLIFTPITNALMIQQPQARREVLFGRETEVQDLQQRAVSSRPAHLQRPPVPPLQRRAAQGQVLRVGSRHQQRWAEQTSPWPKRRRFGESLKRPLRLFVTLFSQPLWAALPSAGWRLFREAAGGRRRRNAVPRRQQEQRRVRERRL